MLGHHPWVTGIATSAGILGLAATSGMVMLAHHFVDELSRPHALSDDGMFTYEVPQAEPEPLSKYQRSLLFHASNGPLLRGEFWAQPHSAPTVVLCHGYRVSRTHLRPVAALEYRYGYNILMFDFRGHGESESVATSGGNAEVHDLETALLVASRQPETLPGKIIIHGFSMGAAIALLIPPHPEVAAIIADSPYASLDLVLRQIVRWQLTTDANSWRPPLHQLQHAFPTIAWTTVTASRILFRLRFGHALIARPSASFKRWQARKRPKAAEFSPQPPILLIHGVEDQVIPFAHARQIATSANLCNVPLETHFVEQADHCGAYGRDPGQYIRVLQQFLARHLGSDFPYQSSA